MSNGRSGSTRASLLAVATAAGVLVLTFPHLLDGDSVPFYRDLLFFFVPFKHFLGEHLRRGELPLWNPGIFMGTPFLAGWQTGVLYPPSLFLLLPFPFGFDVFLLAHYLIAFAGAYLLLRARGLALAPSWIGAIVFSAGGYLVSMLNLTNHLQGAAWAPWVLLCWSALSRTRSAAALLGFVVVMMLQLLAGSPEAVLMTVTILAAVTVERARSSWAETGSELVILGAVLGLSIGLSAFQLLPTLEYVHESVRSSGFSFDEATQSSLEPVSLLQWLFPHTVPPHQFADISRVGFESSPPWIASLYLGLIPLCLAVAGLVAGRQRRLWGALALGAILVALGKHSPLFAGLYSVAPGLLGKFRYPEKFFFIVHFSAMVLVAEGAERVFQRDRNAIRICLVAAAVFMAIGLLLWSMRWGSPQTYLRTIAVLSGRTGSFSALVDLAEDVGFKAGRLLVVLGSFGAVVVLADRSLVRETAFAVVLALLVSGDLITADGGLNPTLSWSKLRSQRALVEVQELRDERSRIFHYDTISAETKEPVSGLDQWWHVRRGARSFEDFIETLWPTLFMNAGMVDGVATVCGADGLDRDSDASLRRVLSIVPLDLSLKLLRLYGVRFLIGPVPIEGAAIERVTPDPPSPFFAYRVRDPAPLAYLAARLWQASSERDAFNRLISADFRPGRDAVVSELPPGWNDSDREPTDAPGEVRLVSYETDAVRLRAEVMRPALLVLSESYFPGWDATVDGRPAAILRTNALVRGVALDAGSHVVDFRYRPASLRRGVAISMASLALLVIVLVRISRSQRGRTTG